MPTQVGNRERGGETTQSERDWAFAKRALARGDDPEGVIRRIADYRGDEKHSNYARYTVEKAQAALGRKPFQHLDNQTQAPEPIESRGATEGINTDVQAR